MCGAVDLVPPANGDAVRCTEPAGAWDARLAGGRTRRRGESDVPKSERRSPVDLEVRESVAWITLDDPDHGNSFSADSVGALAQAVNAARAADVGVVVLSARGPVFSVGGDLGAFEGAPDTGAYVDELAEALHRVVSELTRLDAIVIAVVRGMAAGAAVPLAAAADIVLAAESARFTLAYTKVGLTPDGGSSLLAASIGLHRALYLALLNPVLTAAEAQAMGLVMEIHPDDDLAEAVEGVVRRLSRGSRTALVAAKHLLREQAIPAPETAMRRETLAMRAAAAGPDGREGVASFLAKRSPAFPSADRRDAPSDPPDGP
jgi:2-(1,2-epoxy-1,2-dihydrophenyl)acetyl-CoA isomerase